MKSSLVYLIAVCFLFCSQQLVAQNQSRVKNAPGTSSLNDQPVIVPMKLVMNRPTVNVKINGQGPYTFVFDTGAGTNVLDPKLVEELGLKSSGTTRIGDPSNPQAIETRTYQLNSISVGDARFEDCPAVAWEAVTHIGVRGIIGLPTFYDALITLDYPDEKLTISKQTLSDSDGSVTYRTSHGGHINIDLAVGDQTINAHLDTGNMGGITIPLGMADKLNLDSEPEVMGQAMTAGGSFKIYSAPFRGKVSLAGRTMEPSTLSFNDRFEWANVGYKAFAENKLTIDQINRRVKLEESTASNRSNATNTVKSRSGQPRYGVMMGRVGDGGMKIQQVIKGSIAESAGLESGDKVLKINGKSITQLDPFARMTAFRNSPLKLTVERDGKPLEIQMKFPE